MNYLRKENFGLSRFTTIQIGGVAERVYFPLNEQGIRETFKEIRQDGKPFFILGGGSNVIIRDGKLEHAVVMSTHLTHYRFRDNTVEVECGLSSSHLAELAVNNNLGGLAFCYGLPGTIGGAVFMNARAYGSEMSDLVREVQVYDYEADEFLTLSKEECGFGYKESVFQNRPYFLYKIIFTLCEGRERMKIWREMEKYRQDRSQKGHFFKPSAGCTFKNNYRAEIPSGKILDELGLKGFQIGGIRVSEKHANFLVNMGGGTYQDYRQMVDIIQAKVWEQKQLKLECEVRFLP